MEYHVILWLVLECFNIASSDCPSNCNCDSSKLECFHVIPDSIPPSTAEVTVYEALLGEFNFSDGWGNVTRLSLNPGLSAYHNSQEITKSLYAYEFIKLKSLETLQIACSCLGYIELNAFYGLDKLKVLDLSNNAGLSIESVARGLRGVDNLPNLSELYLSHTSQSVPDQTAFVIGKQFLSAVKHKPLKVLDISNNANAWFDDQDADTLQQAELMTAFPFLEKLNISNSGIVLASLWRPFFLLNIHPNVTSFKSLKSYDISYVKIPFFPRFGSQFTQKHYYMYQVPHGLTELYIKKLITVPGKLQGTPNLTTHICVWFEPIKGNNKTCFFGKFENLKKLVVADNMLQYFGPNILKACPNLQYLDFSINKLGDAISEGYIRSVLDILSKLEIFILSDNGIYSLPEDTFTNSKNLQVLDLARNQLQSITFKTDSFPSLTKLDLSDNDITFLDEMSLNRLDNLMYPSESRKETTNVEVKLKSNPFLCSCETIRFLNWLTSLNESFTCTLESEQRYIDTFVIQRAEYLCKEKIIITVFIIFSLTVTMLIATMVYFLVMERRKLLLAKRTQLGIDQFLANEQKKPHPVFLSFCCEDDEIVIAEIVPNLENGLKKLLNTDAPCVASGYTSFRPGFSLANEIIRCVEASSVVVFFVTNAFCRKMWCRNETLVAHYENKPIVLMIWEHVDEKLMPKYMYKHYQEHARVHWVLENGERVMKPGWDELCEAIVRLFTENPAINDGNNVAQP